jgi:hypothetical protein
MVGTESIVSIIYRHFHIYTVHVRTLEDLRDFVNMEYKNILGHSKTQWLSLMPAVKRIVVVYPALASHFSATGKCPTHHIEEIL